MDIYNYSKNAFSIYRFLSADRCQHFIEKAEAEGFARAKINDGSGETEMLSVRNNSRIIFDDYVLATEMWGLLERFVPKTIDDWISNRINERFRIYKYDKFQSFKWHRDLPYRPSDTEVSKLTFMIYLNNDFEGGYTDFEDFKIWPEQGMAAIFNHKLRHEGSTVTHGTKYVLRSDVIYSKPKSQ